MRLNSFGLEIFSPLYLKIKLKANFEGVSRKPLQAEVQFVIDSCCLLANQIISTIPEQGL